MAKSLDGGRIGVNGIIRDLLDPARVALAPHMPALPEAHARALLEALIEAVERNMPADLQRQDRRLQEAKALLAVMRGEPDAGDELSRMPVWMRSTSEL